MAARISYALPLFFSLVSACSSTSTPAGTDDGGVSAQDDAQGDDTQTDSASAMGDSGSTTETGPMPTPKSAGCGKASTLAAGGVQVTIDAGAAGDGMRGFFLSLPAHYDPNVPHKLIVGYPGTDWVGKQIQPYLDLEKDAHDDEIFAYPDPLWRDFTGWGHEGGWLLGPNASPANGNQDLVFTTALLDYMEANYCIDTSREFATGHSWGGDMAQVVSCFLGDRFRASVPVAANRPYWFKKSDGSMETCKGKTAVWTMFGIGDDHFTWQDHPGQFGDEDRDFWLNESHCAGEAQHSALPYGSGSECWEYAGCNRATRYCLYGPATGHQRPDYYPQATMTFFRSF